MAQQQVLEGTLEHLLRQLEKLPKTQKYRIIITPEESQAAFDRGERLQFGMFPQLKGLTEEDFQSAEWRGEDMDI